MLFEIATLSCPLMRVADIGEGAQDWAAESAAGSLLGCWKTEIGTLGRVVLLRGFAQPEAMTEERRRALLSPDPFKIAAIATELRTESYTAFPFLPPVETGPRGGIYELRSYWLKPGGLPATLEGWEAAYGPAGFYTRHLVTALYALDGPPRITHLWAFDSLAQRSELRGRAYAEGVWPPKGGPEQIATATSTIMLPLDGSALK